MTLEQTSIVSVLGVPVRFSSNRPQVISVVSETFGRIEPEGEPVPGAPSVRVHVEAGDEALADAPELNSVLEGASRFVVRGPGVHAVADARAGTAVATVSSEMVARRDLFQYGIVDALTLFLVTGRDRIPFHASAVTQRGVAVLVTGPSGVGKSATAYAAMRAGMRILSDDAVYLQVEGRAALWASMRHLRLAEDTSQLFPELRGMGPVSQPNGKRKLQVDVVARSMTAAIPHEGPVAVCVLSRSSEPETVLEPIPWDRALPMLTAELEPGFDRFTTALARALPRVVTRGVWRLALAGPPSAAVPLLETILTP